MHVRATWVLVAVLLASFVAAARPARAAQDEERPIPPPATQPVPLSRPPASPSSALPDTSRSPVVTPPVVAPTRAASTALAVQVDCDGCDMDYVRTVLPFASFVRDPEGAIVQVLVTTSRTGAGGTQYALAFYGRGAFEALADTLLFVAGPGETDDAIRRGIARTLAMGLARYAARTAAAEHFRLVYDGGAIGAPLLTAAGDPWRHWVFTVTANGFLAGQQSSSLFNIVATTGVDHITAGWKITGAVSGSYAESRFDVGDSSTVTTYTRRGSARLLFARAIDEHWSAGLSSSWAHSTYDNTDMATTLAPAVEFDVFPYGESPTRQLRFLYRTGPRWFRYNEETIYGMTRKRQSAEELSVTLDLRQRWGSARVKVDGSHYFFDMTKNRMDLSSSVWFRLTRGLSLNANGSFSRVRDQLSLPRRDATEEEILLQIRQLASGYTYSASLGLAYTFGSIYSAVVNPRFGD